MASGTSFHLVSSKAIEQFVLLAKTAKGQAVVELVKEALEAPGVYVFGELMDTPAIKQLAIGSNKSYHDLLQVFAYGTLSDYLSSQSSLPALTAAQLNKLRQLTIAQLAVRNKTITYETLLIELNIQNIRELEDTIIEAFYANVIHGQLDQVNKQLIVYNFIGRDIKDEDIPNMIEKLEAWCANCSEVLDTTESEMIEANLRKEKTCDTRQKLDAQVSMLRNTIQIQTGGLSKQQAPMEDMEVGPYKKLRGSARSGGMFLKS